MVNSDDTRTDTRLANVWDCVWSAFPWSTVWTNKILPFDRSSGSSRFWATPNRRLARSQHNPTLWFYLLSTGGIPFTTRIESVFTGWAVHYAAPSSCSCGLFAKNFLPKEFLSIFTKIYCHQNKLVYGSIISWLHHPMHSVFRSVISFSCIFIWQDINMHLL